MRATSDAVQYEELRAAGPEGQGRAGAGLGGGGRHGRARRAPRCAGAASRRSWAATTSWPRSRRSTSASCARARPHLVTLVGEAGVGKSRLLREFERVLRRAPDAPDLPHRPLPRPTARASSSGRWARCCAPSAGSWTPTPPTRPGGSCSAYVARPVRRRRPEPLDEPGEREAALIGRLLGIEVPARARARRSEDPERLREAFFSALRSGIEALRPAAAARDRLRGHPLGGRRHARRDRAPGAVGARAADARLPGPRRAARPAAGLGRRAALGHPAAARPAEPPRTRARSWPRCFPDGDGMRRGAVVERSGGNPLFAEEMARRIAEARQRAAATELPDTVQAVLAARLDALEPFERRVVQQAAVVGRTFWEASLAPLAEAEGRELDRTLTALQEKDILAPGRRGPPGRRARAGLQARADPRRGLRDAAQGGALAKALRGGRVHRGARGRPHRRGGGAAGRALRPRRVARPRGRAWRATSSPRCASARCASSRRRATPPRCSTRTARRRATTATPARSAPDGDRAARVRIGEKLGDVSLRLGRVDEAIEVWQECLDWHRGAGGPRPRGRPPPQDRRRRSPTRASARRRSSTTSAASTC